MKRERERYIFFLSFHFLLFYWFVLERFSLAIKSNVLRLMFHLFYYSVCQFNMSPICRYVFLKVHIHYTVLNSFHFLSLYRLAFKVLVLCEQFDWLIDFNGMSTGLGLFYIKIVRESRSLYVHIYIFDPIYQPLRSGRIWHKVNF